jgi:hypothetical protein
MKDIFKMKKIVSEQQEAVFQERGLATFFGTPCPKYISAREQSLAELDEKLNEILSNMEDMAD